MTQPLISVIVPCYNVEEYLKTTVESILNQTYQNWELILVDDGSRDNTPQMCDEYLKTDKRIKVIHKLNGGLVSARNAGFNVAGGEWHMYLDGDDWIDADTCEKLVEYINKYEGLDIVFWKCIQELGEISIKGKWEWHCVDQEHIYLDKECHNLARNTLVYKSGIATAYCKLIRREYAVKNGIKHCDKLRQGAEGLEFSLRAFYYAKKALFINEYFNHYRYNPNSISKKNDEINTQYLLECFDVIKEDIESFEDKKNFEDDFHQRVAYVMIAIAMSTYFHPTNSESLSAKIKKYADVIKNNELFSVALEKCKVGGMDNQRKLTLMFIRMRMYFMLPVIGWIKQYYLKRGKFNY